MKHIIIIVGVVFAFAATEAGSQDPLKGGTLKQKAEFDGKVLAVFVKDPAKGAYLSDGAVKQLASRAFLVGDAVNVGAGPDVPKGTRVWVAIDEITEILEYPNLEAAKEIHRLKPKN